MLKLSTVKTETYEIGDIRLDFVEYDEYYEGWLYLDDYGHKKLIYGLPKNQQCKECALCMMLGDIPESLPDYFEEMDKLEILPQDI